MNPNPSLWLLVLVICSPACDGGLQTTQRTNSQESLVEIAAQVIQSHLSKCHLVFASVRRHSLIFSSLISLSTEDGVAGGVVVDGETLPPAPNTSYPLTYQEKRKLSNLWQEGNATCRVLVVDFTDQDIQTAGKVAEWAALWTQPRTRVVGVGGRAGVEGLLLHPSLRNTKDALYIASNHNATQEKDRDVTTLWRRCEYCAAGEAGVEVLGRWTRRAPGIPAHPGLFREREENYNLHKFRVVENNIFPYTNGDPVSEEPGTLVIHKDAVGTRIIRLLARTLNFTYEVREPVDRKWGSEVERGIWNGIVGTLMREDADICLDLTMTPGRASVVEYAGAHIGESVVALSLKPRPLPEYLSLIRPFKWEIWLLVGACVVLWGVVAWLLQKIWSQALGGINLDLISAIFYSLGLLLEDPTKNPPTNITGQMLVGWWLTACVFITSFYRSLLVSHLAVPGKAPVVDNMEDLVAKDGWLWATVWLKGMLMVTIKNSQDPVKRKVYTEMQGMKINEGMDNVLGGEFAFFYSYYSLRTLVATKYTDATGYSPIHIGTKKYDLYFGNSFCVRPGAPFLKHFHSNRQRLMEAGLISYWMDDVIKLHVREERRKKGHQTIAIADQYEEGQVVLTLQHLMGVFFMLALGNAAGTIAFLAEQRERF